MEHYSTKKIKKNSIERYSIDISYPEFNTAANKYLVKANEFISGYLKDLLDRFHRDFKENQKQSLTVNYNIYRVESSLVSWEFIISIYSFSAPHPNSRTETFNLDLLHYRLLKLHDIFSTNSDYLKKLSEYCVAVLKSQANKDSIDLTEWIEKGASPIKRNFDKFCLGESELIIFFDSYQVGPYYWGRREVGIPYEMLRNYLQEGCEQFLG